MDSDIDAARPSCQRFLYMHSAGHDQSASRDQMRTAYRAGRTRRRRRQPSHSVLRQGLIEEAKGSAHVHSRRTSIDCSWVIATAGLVLAAVTLDDTLKYAKVEVDRSSAVGYRMHNRTDS